MPMDNFFAKKQLIEKVWAASTLALAVARLFILPDMRTTLGGFVIDGVERKKARTCGA